MIIVAISYLILRISEKYQMNKLMSFFRRSSNGGVKNLSNSHGCIKTKDGLLGFGASGYADFYQDEKVTDEEIEVCRQHIMKVLGFTKALNLPEGCGISLDIIDEAYINPKSENLVITSIAEGKALFIAKPDEYSDMEMLLEEVHNVLIDLSEGKKATVDWQAYAI